MLKVEKKVNLFESIFHLLMTKVSLYTITQVHFDKLVKQYSIKKYFWSKVYLEIIVFLV